MLVSGHIRRSSSRINSASPTRDDASLQLPAIGCSIPLRAIYKGVELAPAPLHNS